MRSEPRFQGSIGSRSALCAGSGTINSSADSRLDLAPAQALAATDPAVRAALRAAMGRSPRRSNPGRPSRSAAPRRPSGQTSVACARRSYVCELVGECPFTSSWSRLRARWRFSTRTASRLVVPWRCDARCGSWWSGLWTSVEDRGVQGAVPPPRGLAARGGGRGEAGEGRLRSGSGLGGTS
jgi:hypothetical protein